MEVLEATTVEDSQATRTPGSDRPTARSLVIQQIRRRLDRPNLFNRLDSGRLVLHQVLLP
ncbi:hypothetical protein [Actinacidiphila glaucinigra]|uniref:hypothetical protein n=1 Tax=Actinacidiphila glaucinigra TaxID=235986 RepID=UPI00371D874E